MLKSKRFQRLLRQQLLILGIVILLGGLLNGVMFSYFKHLLINNNQHIVSSILKKHPELEDEVMESILSNDIEDDTVLNKYDLDNTNSINQLSLVRDVRGTILKFNIIYITFAFLCISVSYLVYIYQYNRRIRKINQGLSSALNDDFKLEMNSYEEGEISNLKNDLQKIIIMLKDYNEKANLDKVELEKTLSDISHQLKTPLTSMYVINDLLMDEKIDSEKRKEMLAKNRKQLERIEWLVSSLLKISRLDSGVVILKKRSISARELVERALSPLLIPIELKKQNLILDIDDITLECDNHWTVEALINIIKNAHEHTPEAGTITIRVKENPIYTGISVIDDGEGISKKDLPHVFERFYKGSGNINSIGIGLNMAKSIITKQSGDISIKSVKHKGTTFLIKLYKNII